jgi:hypothetical protein
MNESSQNEASPALPDLNQSMLDSATFEALCRDLRACTEITEVIPKYGAEAYVPEDAQLTLERGWELLQAGQLRGLQVRYRYDGADWWDTLMKTSGGIRLVRIRHDFNSA